MDNWKAGKVWRRKKKTVSVKAKNSQTQNNKVEKKTTRTHTYSDRFVLFIFNFKIYYITCDRTATSKYEIRSKFGISRNAKLNLFSYVQIESTQFHFFCSSFGLTLKYEKKNTYTNSYYE